MKKLDWYQEFVDLDYKPSKNEVICLFRFEPASGISIKDAVGRIASESSAGTWTTLSKLPSRINKVMASSFEINGNFVKVAYPSDIWEYGNIAQLLSGIAGNIFGIKALKNLKLVDVLLPRAYTKYFKGPQFGIDGIRKILKIRDRPVTGAVAKPKIGWSSVEHAEISYETWMGGFDLVKDDENLTSLPFNKFEDRARLCAKMREKAERETGERKSILLNITGETRVMIKRAKTVQDLGLEYVMVDVLTAGFSALQTVREVCEDYGLAMHAHRAMHAALDRNPKHGISMLFLAKLCRLVGVDQLHIGTVVGKLAGTRKEVLDIKNEITSRKIKALENYLLNQEWGKIRPVLPVSSGGLHPGIIPSVLKILGPNIGLLVSGGIHGHPHGTRAGAKAARQAIEATMKSVSLEEYARTHTELRVALKKWGHLRPR